MSNQNMLFNFLTGLTKHELYLASSVMLSVMTFSVLLEN